MNKLLVYSISESLRDPVDVLTPRLESIFDLPSIVVHIPEDSTSSCCRCDVQSHALPVGHFYPDVEDAVLSFSAPCKRDLLLNEGPDFCELHIPAQLLLNHNLVPSGTRRAVTAPEVPLHLREYKVQFNRRTRILGRGLPSTFAGRTVAFEIRQCHWPPQPPQSSSSAVPPELSDTGTMPDEVATLVAHQEPSRVRVLVMVDHHPRRVARALARNDAHITFSLTQKPPFDVNNMVAEKAETERSAQWGEKQVPYIRTQVVLPDELQGPLDFNHSFDVAWCGDAVVVFQASIACSPFSGMD